MVGDQNKRKEMEGVEEKNREVRYGKGQLKLRDIFRVKID